jgi:hypothetical protein
VNKEKKKCNLTFRGENNSIVCSKTGYIHIEEKAKKVTLLYNGFAKNKISDRSRHISHQDNVTDLRLRFFVLNFDYLYAVMVNFLIHFLYHPKYQIRVIFPVYINLTYIETHEYFSKIYPEREIHRSVKQIENI